MKREELKNIIKEVIMELDNSIKKPTGYILSKDSAQKICSEWHDGGSSALYSFASTKQYIDNKYNDYIQEINESLKLSDKSGVKELNALKKFFDYLHWKENQ